MQISYKDKRNKTCKITIEGFNTPIIDLTRYQSPISTKTIKGNRNTVLKELKQYLKAHSFHRPALSKIVNAINKTSMLYTSKEVVKNYCKSVNTIFNSETNMSYVITVEYELIRQQKAIDETKCNNHGENIYQKRLCQRYGGELILRYETACDKINFSKLFELIKEPIMNGLIRKVTTRSVGKVHKLEITTPEEVELLVTDDIKIGVRFFDTYRNYRFNSAGVLGMEVLLAVSYQDKQIYEPSMKPDVFTEEIVKDMEEQAEMFEKVLDIVKEEC